MDILLSVFDEIFAFLIMMFVTLAIAIVVHEWGHYIAARFFGVRVEVFSLGFGKELYSFGGSKEEDTRFSVRILPAGGYIKLFGDIDPEDPKIWDKELNDARPLTEREQKYAYYNKPAWQRLFIVLAGPLANLLLAVLITISLYTIYGQRSVPVVINAIAIDSPAHQAGVQIGDRIVAMDGQKNRRLDDIHRITWYEIPPKEHTYDVVRGDDQHLSFTFAAKERSYINEKGIKMHHGQTGMLHMVAIDLKESLVKINGVNVEENPNAARHIIKRNFDKLIEVQLRPFVKSENPTQDATDSRFLMVFPSRYNVHFDDPDDEHYNKVFLSDTDNRLHVRLPFLEAVSFSFFRLYKGIIDTFKFIAASFDGGHDEQVVAGAGRVSELIGESVRAGYYEYILLLANFSFMIALMNIFPLPPLDGGYILFLVYEIIRGKPIPTRIQTISIIFGVIVLLGIMLYANFSDLVTFASSD
ncbi:MAG: RIP metalloprotease RseP [Alphaproteobacteria bacterium]